jgi:hypothetical protein
MSSNLIKENIIINKLEERNRKDGRKRRKEGIKKNI